LQVAEYGRVDVLKLLKFVHNQIERTLLAYLKKVLEEILEVVDARGDKHVEGVPYLLREGLDQDGFGFSAHKKINRI